MSKRFDPVIAGRLGKWAEARRAKLGLTYREVSSRAGLSIAFLFDLEHGRRGLSITSLPKLEAVYGPAPDFARGPCKHRRTWIIGNEYASLLWCYQCGAIRHNLPGERWTRPTGPGGPNPAIEEARS